MSRGRAIVVALALALMAAQSGCVLVASTGEYRVYRKLRLTDSNLTRGALIRRYERDYPNGALKAKIAAERRHLEETMYAAAIDEYGLQQYLGALPDGEHRVEAERRLEQARQVRAARRLGERAQADRQAAVAAQEDQQRRAWFRGAFSGWVQILARVGSWNTPLSEFLSANPELAAVWREGGTAPVCNGDVCTREYPHDYFIRRRGETRIDRQARFLLRIHQTAGKVTRIDALLAGQGFYAWRELESQEEIDAEDPAAMAEVRDLARTALSEMIRAHVPDGAVAEIPSGSATVLWAFTRPPIRILVLAAPAGAADAGPGEGLSVVYSPVAATPPPPARRR